MDSENSYDVVIIGAGITGISAGLVLNKTQHNWIILEGQDHIGGRIQSIQFQNTRLDTGAYEICAMGEKALNNFPLHQLIKEKQVKLQYRLQLSESLYVDETGYIFTQQDHQVVEECLQNIFKHMKKRIKKGILESYYQAAKAVLEKYLDVNDNTLTPEQKRLLNLEINMVEQEDAASIEEVSSLTLGFQEEDQLQMDAYPLPLGTYHKMIEGFAKDMPSENIKLSTKVTKIQKIQNKIYISVVNEKGEEKIYKCKKVICTVSIKVLQNNEIQFVPPLPEKHQESLKKLNLGVMDKIILSFEKPFWKENLQRIKFAASQKGKFSHFINLSTKQSYILCCFITDNFAKRLHKEYSDKQIAEYAVQFLKSVFPKEEIVMKNYHVTNWYSNQFIRGSFTCFGPHASIQTTIDLRTSVDNWLWIAGEHCYGQNMGSAHGAFTIGHRAAKEIVSLLSPQ